MNGTLFIDFSLVVAIFVRFTGLEILNSYIDFSFNVFSLIMTVASIETLEK